MPAEYLVISLSILNKGKNEREKLNIWSCLTYSSPKFYWLVPDTQVERERERVVQRCSRQNRSSHQRCSIKKDVLSNFTKFKGKDLCQSLFLNKNADLRHRCFPVNFAQFLRTRFYRTPPATASDYSYSKKLRNIYTKISMTESFVSNFVNQQTLTL